MGEAEHGREPLRLPAPPLLSPVPVVQTSPTRPERMLDAQPVSDPNAVSENEHIAHDELLVCLLLSQR